MPHIEELQSAKDSKTMFRVVNGLLNNSNKVLPAHESAEVMSNNFAKYFQEKVSKIYSGVKNTSSTVMSNEYDNKVSCKLSELNLVSEDDVCKLISSAASKSCVLDCIPTWFLKTILLYLCQS